MKPWRLGQKIVCVDVNWHINLVAKAPHIGEVVTIDRIDWNDRQAAHSRCGLHLAEYRRGIFCDCHFRPATDSPNERATRRAPSPARELEAA